MRLQNLIVPKAEVCAINEMYYRYNEKMVYFSDEKNAFVMNKNSELRADTYFNSFSWDKWNKYTLLKHVYLEIEILGQVDVYLYQMQYINGRVTEKIVNAQRIECRNKQLIRIDYKQDDFLKGILAFKIRCLSDETLFYGGGYATDIDEKECNDINLAINICTYKREKYVYRNMKILENQIFKEDSELKDHLKVFITDNGSSLDEGALENYWIHLVKQGDNGSAGGFTRGLIEIIHANEKKKFSNVIMMDDDVLIEPEAIRKTYMFLKIQKKEYMDSFIGGGLLRTDWQNVQYISGGTWSTEQRYQMHKIWYDLKECSNVIKNEIEDNPNVNGWWYCCIPMSVIRKDNLPWPSYFHMDDMEYDIRNCKKMILLNGICVWHEPFENKPSSYTQYYDTRNIIITHFIHYPKWGKKELHRFVRQAVMAQLQKYRYKECWIVIKALNDLTKGPGWLENINPVDHFEQIIEMGYKKDLPEKFDIHFDWDMYYNSKNYSEGFRQKIFRWITLNGHFFSKVKRLYTVVPMFAPHPGAIYRSKKILNYDMVSERAYVTEKNILEAIKVCWSYICIQSKLRISFKKLRAQYKEKFSYMQTEEFWGNYLR